MQHIDDYTTFNKAILRCAEQTAMIVKSKCQGWFHHSRDTLAPTLEAQNEVLHVMRSTKGPTSAETLSKLRRLQNKVDEAVGTAKTIWSRLLAQNIHNMSFSPKAAGANVRLPSKGEKSHHFAPKTIHMRLPSGELAE